MRIVLALQIPAMFLFAACAHTGAPALERPLDGSEVQTSLQVTVEGLRSHDGKVLLALFSSDNGFPGERDKAVRWMEKKIDDDHVTFTIVDVPTGRYAISVFHDENANDKMETDFFGRPTEGYGFSRNARGRFGPPSFDDAAIVVSDEPMTIRVDLVYD